MEGTRRLSRETSLIRRLLPLALLVCAPCASAQVDAGTETLQGIEARLLSASAASRKTYFTELLSLTISSAPDSRRVPGWPSRVGAVDLDAKHSLGDIGAYLQEKHPPTIFAELARTGLPVEFHYGSWDDTARSLYDRGVREALTIRRESPNPATVFFFAHMPDGKLLSGATQVFGEDRFDHLLLQARFGFHLHGGPPKRIIQVYFSQDYSRDFKAALGETLAHTEDRVDSAVFGFKGSVKNGLLERFRAHQNLLSLRGFLGAKPFAALHGLAERKLLRIPADAPERGTLEEVARLTHRLSASVDTRPSNCPYANVSCLDAMTEDFPPLAASLASVKTLLGIEGWSDIARPIPELLFWESADHAVLPHTLAYYRDSAGKTRSLLSFRNIYGNATFPAVQEVLEHGATRIAAFGSCGALRPGARVVDIFLPSESRGGVPPETLRFHNGLSDWAGDIDADMGTLIQERAFGHTVFSPLVETQDTLRELRKLNTGFVEGELHPLLTAWNAAHVTPRPQVGAVFIASDIPGSAETLAGDEADRWKKVLRSQRVALGGLARFLDIAELLPPPHRDVPIRRIGFFFGTFDPIHEGHLAVARKAVLSLGLTRVYLIPNLSPSHKPGATPFLTRYELLRLALADEASLDTLPADLITEGFEYGGVDSMIEEIKIYAREKLEHASGVAFYQIVGGDSFEKMIGYGVAEASARRHMVVVVDRPGYPLTAGANRFLQLHLGRVLMLDAEGIPEVSSTLIRQAAAHDQDLPYLKKKVSAYIREKGLYKTK